jgi:cellulose 1,4-beta-cellobiosidase
LKGKEFTFDVDVSNLPCGLNGALYFVEMDADGGLGKYPGNTAGAQYGTGYCDAQCPHDIKWINGEANLLNWKPSPDDPNSGTGQYGTCCTELDIWEGNAASNAYTPHPCSVKGPYRCQGAECGTPDRYGGVCDMDGCDYNPYRLGNTTYYGPKGMVDTTRPFTVVTQFLNNSNGGLAEMRRLYVQDGRVIKNSRVNVPGVGHYDSVTDKSCAEVKQAFGDKNDFATKGGLQKMAEALDRGLVLVLSLWDDHAAHMLWLDSDYPPSKTGPGISRGNCPTSSGDPKDVESRFPNSSVKFSKIRVGDIGSTY